MSDIGKDIILGLEAAIAHERGEKRGHVTYVEVPDVDVKAARAALKMSQNDFASFFGISARTLENWEQGHRQPTGPARTLLYLIAKNPAGVRKALTS